MHLLRLGCATLADAYRMTRGTLISVSKILFDSCVQLLDRLMKDPDAWAFLEPVSAEDVPDYHDFVKASTPAWGWRRWLVY